VLVNPINVVNLQGFPSMAGYTPWGKTIISSGIMNT
jgi:hypothetical protein